jgi:hypothetical protein
MLSTALTGCAIDENIFPEEPIGNQNIGHSNHAIYDANQGVSNFWVGRGVSRLVATRGEPDLIINTMPRGVGSTGGLHTLGYIYGLKPGNEGKCIDTYVVSLDTGTVIRYYCR